MKRKILSLLFISTCLFTSAQSVLTITQPVVAAYSSNNAIASVAVLPQIEQASGNAVYYFGMTILPIGTTDGIETAKTTPFCVGYEGNQIVVKGLSGATNISVYSQGGMLIRNIKTSDDSAIIDPISLPMISIVKVESASGSAMYKLLKRK